MARKQDAPKARPVTAEDVDPRYRWDRPLQAPGHTQVDFEERVDFRRLHAYRLGRARQALARSGLGAILVFDQYNIRYLSGTVIGEWARDKLTRWCLLTGQRRAVGVGLRLRRAPPSALRAVDTRPPVAGGHGRHARRGLAESRALPEGGRRDPETS